jgi:signal transduction histidine kinase
LNAQLNEANQTKAKLFGILGHDLRAPISQVYQLLKLQQQNVGISAAVQAQLSDKVQQAAGALLETLEDLLLWSKSQLSAFSIHKTNIALRPIIDQVFDLLQLAVEEKNIHIQNNVSMDDYIYTDHQLLQIILRNLIQNAIQASPIEGTIEVTFSSDNKVLQIRNKGNAFTQADYLVAIAKNDSGKSTSGLGLKLVQELSDKLGLQLKFDNPDALTTIAIICF